MQICALALSGLLTLFVRIALLESNSAVATRCDVAVNCALSVIDNCCSISTSIWYTDTMLYFD